MLVDYTGWYEADDDDLYETEGDSLVKFDSSVDRGEPIAFGLGRGRVIAGWERRPARAWPWAASAGCASGRTWPTAPTAGPPYIPGGATLVFDVQVLGKPQVDVTAWRCRATARWPSRVIA